VRYCWSIIAGLVVLFSVTEAQVRIGVHGGTDISSLTGPLDWKWQARPMIGIALDVELLENFLLVGQVNYAEKWTSRRGFWDGDPPTADMQLTVMHRYIEIPVYLRWRVGTSPLRWFCEAGPVLGRMVLPRVEWWVPGFAPVEGGEWGEFNRTGLSFAIGTGIEWAVALGMSASVSMHHSRSVIGLWRGDSEQKLVGIQIEAGVMWAL
jgi:hypothetical protein